MRKSRTTPQAIAKVERISAILQARFEGLTYREIGQRLDPPVSAQAVWKVVWRALREHPFGARRRPAYSASDDDP